MQETPQNLKIIIIDDNPAIHEDFLKILTRESSLSSYDELTEIEQEFFGYKKQESPWPDFKIDTASQGKEGAEKIAIALKKKEPYALAFVDIRMPPGWDGIETIKQIWKLDSTIQVVICSAYSDYTWEETVKQLGHTDNLLILRKPFDNIAVRQLAFALTKKWYLLQQSQHYTRALEEQISKRTESLQKSFSLVRATLDSSSEGMLVVNNQKKFIDFNQKFLEIWSLSEKEVKKYNHDAVKVFEFISNQISDANDFLVQIKKLEANTDGVVSGTVELKDKRVYEYFTQPYMLYEQIIGRVWSFRDVSMRALLEEKLHYQATHDPLTKLPNRMLMVDFMSQAIADAVRNNQLFAVLFLDLDHFKLINDSLSHEVGDAVLCAVAGRLQALIRQTDILVRLGGDEFILIIRDVKNSADIIPLAKKIIDSFSQPFAVENRELTITTSMGICFYPTDGDSIELLLRNADNAMYQAKDLGANQYQFYTEELNKLNIIRLEKESELRRALLNNEFFLCYQPQYHLNSGKLLSIEALIRWNHPQQGIIMPEDFIPLAEDMGITVPIGEWVLRTACKQIRAWKDQGLPLIRVAVNVTTKQFKAYNFLQLIKNILEETALSPEYLELELSENIIVSNLDIVNTVCDLKKLGVQIALDDFGTGYSSLNYLKQIPLDRLKIDQSYVKNITAKRGDDVIIQAIIAIAKRLNLEVVAEGVETKDQLDFLKKENCNDVQGFYFNKPLEAGEFEAILKTLDKPPKK